jgi:S1-C subfamily serine protease
VPAPRRLALPELSDTNNRSGRRRNPLALLLAQFVFLLAPRAACAQAPSERAAWPSNAVVQLIAVGPAGYGNSRECSATGLLLDRQGDLLTNAHVVQLARRRCLQGNPTAQLLVKLSNSASPRARALGGHVVALDKAHDLALLRTDSPPHLPEAIFEVPLQLEDHEPEVGTMLFVAGFPASSWQPVIESGPVVGYQNERLAKSSHGFTRMMIVRVGLQPGSSGSPVYFKDGKLAGIAEARFAHDPARALVVPARYVAAFLAGHGVSLAAPGACSPSVVILDPRGGRRAGFPPGAVAHDDGWAGQRCSFPRLQHAWSGVGRASTGAFPCPHKSHTMVQSLGGPLCCQGCRSGRFPAYA